MKVLKGLSYDPLDVKAPGWHQDFSKLKEQVKGLEVELNNAIMSSFETATLTADAFCMQEGMTHTFTHTHTHTHTQTQYRESSIHKRSTDRWVHTHVRPTYYVVQNTLYIVREHILGYKHTLDQHTM